MVKEIKELHVGNRVEAMFKVNPSGDLFDDVWLPVKVIQEYEYFWVCRVLPHRNPKHSWGISRPYIMTIDKFNLKCGDVKCRPITRK